jgi:chromosome segregation ATPase
MSTIPHDVEFQAWHNRVARLEAERDELAAKLAEATENLDDCALQLHMARGQISADAQLLAAANARLAEVRDDVVLWKTIAESAGNRELAMTAQRDAANLCGCAITRRREGLGPFPPQETTK